MKDLKSKMVLITGGSSGIGESFVYQFAELGTNLIIVARSESPLNNLADTIKEKYKVDCYPIVLDLSKENAAKELFEKINSLHLEVDVLVNNAGVGAIGKFEEYDLERYHSMLQLNINALTELCLLYLPGMKKKNSGGIINVASTEAFLPIPNSAVYVASKSYVLNFSESLFGELYGTNVTVTCLCPSRTKTNFAKNANSPFKNYESKPYDTPDNSAKVGIKAFLKGKNTVISGPQKFLVTVLPRLVSRSRMIKLTSTQYKK
ncbi:MAG: SDR family oxidoreductase [Ginsengibacter sp.]